MSTSYACNVVIDLEFTHVPKKRRVNGLATEIIEIGAMKVASDGTIAGEFSHVVKPTLTSGVSGMVHRMTGIGDEDLTCAKKLEEVLEALLTWIGSGRIRFVTWSDTDRKQIERECAAKDISMELPSRWMDIQRLYPRLMGMDRKRLIALDRAADWCGIENDKRSAHRALYDARMTAEIFCMMKAGECAEHRARVASELGDPKEVTSLSSSIGSRCTGLGDLLASLMSKEVLAA